ncbi:hypothetical protein KP509_28G020600 [Ceratopteris richardii]|nr:hypothetical protein KP509_28G020600 [Ceratopteris richardii]KAH7293316.1 hypothetical protein KP509_28G020600 [Ceratopteris richardii]
MKGKQDNSIAAPRNIKVEGSELDMKNSNRAADGIASSSLKEEANEIVEFGSAVGISDASAPPNREKVLKACVTTCSVLFMVGVLIQQATHFAAESGLSVPESMLSLKFSLEVEDLKVICGLILTISFSRQLLLLIWPEFLESSEAANKEVLKPLKPIDYAVVAILPAISEELLFRGALLPLCGLDWKGITVTGLFFGVLHLTGGRKNAFAIWASIVGMLYGLAYVRTGSVLVPMVAHGANNLIGATIWKLKQEGSQPGQ